MATKAKPKKPDIAPAPPLAEWHLLSIEQVCAALSCSERYLRSMVHNKEFPEADSQIGNRPRWTGYRVAEWVKGQYEAAKAKGV